MAVSGYLQEKFEATPGNETAAPSLSTKIMYPVITDWQPTPGTDHLNRDDELRNTEEPLAVITERHVPTWAVNARAYPDHLGWRLTHILGKPTTTAGDGIITDPDSATIPATAYRHVWDSTVTSLWGYPGTAPLTAQQVAAYNNHGVYYKLKGCACESLGLTTPTQGGMQLSAGGPALFLDDSIADPAATPAQEALTIRPFTRRDLTLGTWLSGTDTHHEDLTVNISNPVEAIQTMGGGSKWPDVMEKGEGIIQVTGSLSQRMIDPQDLAALRAATGFAAKIKWASETNIAATSYKYSLWAESVNAQYTGGTPGALANNRRIGSTFDFRFATAGTGSAIKITLVNATANYN